ncbi:uncharacterized protein FPRO_11880 [Fusarium proliferatum ET1]|uniref:Uncharacterized protein n=2 Tax=Gibberella intermedia TaxID=948311 RepID=A0A1L7W1U4_FUSPR|nr:uncharacterized protein FPRO_11880 [Fusarium proliferatum ET1]RBA13878.1 hypothetical protein FPRO05_02670 [Fusarium proliferatum]CZR46432.1 uncharacterized protein FPRO_11880 [Fusarium proliferatum ET1]
MADQSWLRFLGGNRARQHDLKYHVSEATLQDLYKDPPKSKEVHGHRVKKSMTRLPSWQGVSQANQSTTTAAEAEYSLDEVDKLFINANQQIWHNPSIDQVAETLQVAVISNPASEALSAEYRSHILLLCEAYGTGHRKIAKLERELAEAKMALKEEASRHSFIEEHWMVQDARYKAEVKRLEMFIHRTSDQGMEAVALARAGSLLRGRAGAATIGQRAINSDVVDEGTSNGAPEVTVKNERNPTLLTRQDTVLSRTRTMDTSNEIRLSRGFRVQDHLKKKKVTAGVRRLETHADRDGKTRPEQGREEMHPRSASMLSIGPDGRGTADMSPHKDSARRERDASEEAASMEEVGIVSRTNSTSTSLTQNQSSQDTVTELRCDRRSHQIDSRHHRQFSFVPGDDITAVRSGGTRGSGKALGQHIQKSQAPTTSREAVRFCEENRRSRSVEWIRMIEQRSSDIDDNPGASDLRL